MATINFRISKTGEVKLEVSGAEGSVCEDLTRVFEQELGVVTDVQRKPEYFLDHLSTDVQVFEHE